MARGWFTTQLERYGEHIARYGWCDASGMLIAPDPSLLASPEMSDDLDDDENGGSSRVVDRSPDQGPQMLTAARMAAATSA